MSDAFVFGYGSLVNTATHNYGTTYTACLSGWRRTWRHVEGRSVAFLTVVPDSDSVVDGLIAPVSSDAWPELDQRERSYIRETGLDLEHDLPGIPDVHVYHAPETLHRPHSTQHPILLSYLDVVIQGYFRAFGPAGVTRFFQKTDGWDAPILDDRAAPRYPRHQRLSRQETDLCDQALAEVGARLIND